MTSRVGLRFLNTFRQTILRQPILQRRSVQSSAGVPTQGINAAGTPGGAQQSAFSKFYNSEVGPKTVHFWAPIMKWALALAGAADFARPASSLSLSQNAALMTTGAIWTRWCFIIKPRNLFLASVNFLLFCVGATQVTRVVSYQQSLKNDSVPEELEKAAKQEGGTLEGIAKDPKGAIENAKKV